MKCIYTLSIIFTIIVCLLSFSITNDFNELSFNMKTLLLITPFAIVIDVVDTRFAYGRKHDG